MSCLFFFFWIRRAGKRERGKATRAERCASLSGTKTIAKNSYVKDFLKAIGPEGLPKLLTGFGDDGAYAQCVFAFAEVKGGEDRAAASAARVFVGRTHGSIARTPRGPRTFGWDCVFVPGGDENKNPAKLTYAEMPSEAKNAISHRRRALDKLRAFLVEEYSK